MHEEDTTPQSGFAALQLAHAVLSAIERIGYEQPTPIQAEAIPHLLAGRDLIGMAQTGTGKTAAFALTLLVEGGDDPWRATTGNCRRCGAADALLATGTQQRNGIRKCSTATRACLKLR